MSRLPNRHTVFVKTRKSVAGIALGLLATTATVTAGPPATGKTFSVNG